MSGIKGAKTETSGRKVVIIRCDEKRGWWEAMFDEKAVAPYPNVTSTPVISYLVTSKADLDKALGILSDGDMLILNAHSNTRLFQFPDEKRIKNVNWLDIWSNANIKVPPRLSAVLIASCMKANETVPPVSMNEIETVRKALHTTILVIPNRTYTTRDAKLGKTIMDDIVDFYSGNIDTAQFLERFRNQGRFGLSFGMLNHEEVMFTNFNVGEVYNGASTPTVFTIREAWLVNEIETYHWNQGQGVTPGTIGLKAADGTTYGPWRADGLPGQGGVVNAHWVVRPQVIIPAGTYTVVDSGFATWAQNDDTMGRGMSLGKGVRIP
jgi:hypothetical protein